MCNTVFLQTKIIRALRSFKQSETQSLHGECINKWMEFSVCLEEWYQLCLEILIILLLRNRAVERFVFPVTPEATKVQWEHKKKWFFLGQTLKIIFSPSQHPVSQTPQERKGSSCHCCFWKERGGAACYREINMPLRVTSEKKKKILFISFQNCIFMMGISFS